MRLRILRISPSDIYSPEGRRAWRLTKTCRDSRLAYKAPTQRAELHVTDIRIWRQGGISSPTTNET